MHISSCSYSPTNGLLFNKQHSLVGCHLHPRGCDLTRGLAYYPYFLPSLSASCTATSVSFREHFEKILNLRTFRDAARIFKLDTSVISEHRSAVARVLIR